MTRSRNLDPVLLARYLSGESTPAECALVEAWAATDARHRVELDELRRAWSTSFPLERPIDLDAAWHRITSRMSGHETAHENTAETPHLPTLLLETGGAADRVPQRQSRQLTALKRLSAAQPRYRGVLAAAAAALVIAGATAIHEHRALAPGLDADAGRTTREFVAAPGQRTLVDLADGTHIVLAPATRLTVSLPKSGAGVRELVLDGEAMFTVTHDTTRPFVVYSRHGTTVDVGTSFAVRAYLNEAYRVVVRDGRVAMGGNVASRNDISTVAHAWPILVAGDVATQRADGTMHVAHGQDADGLLDWSNGRLTFEHTRLADLAPDLERWYGIQIRIATPALRDRLITGQFDTESRTEALKALGRALGARHTIDGTNVTFSAP